MMGLADRQACGRQGRVADTGRVIRPAATADLGRIQEIETAAGELFRALGMDAVADDPPPTIEELTAFLRLGTAWVATVPAGEPIAYILMKVRGSWAHIEQVTVHPNHAHRGIGGDLINHAEGWARGLGLDGLSLTTFRNVPWNGPYYERLGFRYLPDFEWPAELREVVEAEASRGLASWPRAVMTRNISSGPSFEAGPST